MTERITGYFMLALGVIIMAVSVYFVYLLMTSHLKPFDVFQGTIAQPVQQQQQPMSLQDLMSNPSSLTQMQSQIISQVLDKQVNKTMNFTATIFLMYFVMLFGFRVSTLGVQLIRPIHVKLRGIDEREGKHAHNPPPKPPKE